MKQRARLNAVWRSSAARMALGYILLFILSGGLLLGAVQWITARSLTERIDVALQRDLDHIRAADRQSRIGGRDPQGAWTRLSERRSRQLGAFNNLFLVRDGQGNTLAGTLMDWPGRFSGEFRSSLRPRVIPWEDLQLGPDLNPCAPTERPTPLLRHRQRSGPFADAVADNDPEECLEHRWGVEVENPMVRVMTIPLHGGGMALVGRDLSSVQAQTTHMAQVLSMGMLGMVAVAVLGGGLAAWRMGRRLGAINSTADRIIRGDLSKRIPVRGNDDIAALAGNLNQMLDRIETLMDGVRHVSDSVAHDLRTPLTRLRNRLEGLVHSLEAGGSTPAERDEAEAALAEVDGVLATFRALLRIAHVETGGRRAAFAPVDVSALVTDACELYDAVAAEAGQSLEAEIAGNLWVAGDRDLLFQMLANVLDNAVKYGPEGGVIRVGLATAKGYAVLSVVDSGPGIPESEREAVFRRFYRMDGARSTPGNGLGLALVAAVAEAHGAEIALESAGGSAGVGGEGLRVRVWLPLREGV